MTHAQQTHTGTVSLMPVAMAGLVMAAALAGALAVTGQISLPSIQTDASRISQDQAVIDAGRAWEHQQEQQAGRGLVTPDVMDAARDWEQQRKAQVGDQPRITEPSADFMDKVREARGY